MPHEHLLSLLPAGGFARHDEADSLSVDLAVSALAPLADSGFRTVVDLSPYGVVGRDAEGDNVALLAEISQRSGLHIVSGSAIYLESYSPSWALTATLNELTTRLEQDAVMGIGSTDIKAGAFGEQATSLGKITPHEEKCLRAAARAANSTGLALFTHTTHGTMAREQVDILRSESMELERVVVGHMDTQLSIDAARRLLDTGVNIAIDTIGKQRWDFFLGPQTTDRSEGEFSTQSFFRSDEKRADMVAELVAEGYAPRLFLAQDLTGAESWMNQETHGSAGYAYLPTVFLPMLERRGVSVDDIEQMITTNPARVLSVG
jgi:phosphotriesterase-related protein